MHGRAAGPVSVGRAFVRGSLYSCGSRYFRGSRYFPGAVD
jgi:hypothetical protein